MSPPLDVTCWSWKNGLCTLDQNYCLYTHKDTGRRQASFTSHSECSFPLFTSSIIQKRETLTQSNTEPALTGRNAKIAEAAAAAGFDVTDTNNLINLVHAIRAADRAIYPDRYRGSGRYKSDLYPDHWVAAEMRQQRMSENRDLAAQLASVPTFDVSAQRSLRKQLNYDASSGANREPLGAKMSNKRTADDFTPRPTSKIRKIREDHTTVINSYQSTQRITIDLTQEEDAVDSSARSCSSHPALGNLTNYQSMAPGRSGNNKQEVQQSNRSATNSSLHKILDGLKQSEANIEKDREILKERWELDVDLQLQSVTDDLQILNECFLRAKNAIRDAIMIVEDRLL